MTKCRHRPKDITPTVSNITEFFICQGNSPPLQMAAYRRVLKHRLYLLCKKWNASSKLQDPSAIDFSIASFTPTKSPFSISSATTLV